MTTVPQKNPTLILIAAVLGVALGGALTWIGGRAVAFEVSMRSGSEVVEAEVLETRIMTSTRRGDSYELKYRFKVPGSDQVYDHRDASGRSDLFAAVNDENTWSEARSRGTLPVAYLPGDPWVNRPVNADAPIGNAVGGLIAGLLIAVPSVVALVNRWRRRRQDSAGVRAAL